MRASPAPTGHKALRTAIQTGAFDPVYYFHGAEDYLKDEAVRQLVEAAVEPATRDFNLEVLRGAEVDAETLGSLLGTPPMMAPRRVVVVRDAGALRKDARTTLERYVARPAPDLVLVLVAGASAKPDRTLLARATAVEFDHLSGARVPKWIAFYASHELGCEITEDAAGLLQDAVGTELTELRVELEKLASFASGAGRRVIDERAVAEIVGVRRGETLGDLLDAVARRDGAAALALVAPVLAQPKSSAVTAVMALTTQTLALAWGRARRERGVSASRLESDYWALLKESGSTYTGRSWGDAVKCWARHVDVWSAAELDDGLDALLAADAALKETRLSSDEQLLGTLVLALCGARARRAPARVA
jgi:DNA polymerase-3 subunit delta